jgi:hypothetical protein
MPGIYLQYVCKYDTKLQRSALKTKKGVDYTK